MENLIHYLNTVDGANNDSKDMDDFCLDSPEYKYVVIYPSTDGLKIEEVTLPLETPVLRAIKAWDNWQSTQVQVANGELLTVLYIKGDWTEKDNNPGRIHGEYSLYGTRFDNWLPAKQQGSSLIGRIGEQTPFVVGDYYSVHVSGTGELQLRMNDCDQWLGDNE